MSSFVFMKILESAPERYDAGVRMLSHGRIGDVYARVAELAAAPGRDVLDIGCGTGAVALACATQGAHVVGIDRNAEMLAVAQSKPLPPGAGGTVRWLNVSSAEIEDHLAPASLDAVVSCLAFSELPLSEQNYALRTAFSRLRAGGILVIADETEPAAAWARWWRRLRRAPLAAVTYAVTQTTTRAVHGLPERIAAAGFAGVQLERLWSDTFMIVRARKPAPPPATP